MDIDITVSAFIIEIFENAESFRDALRLSNSRWESPGGYPWLFRGVGNSKHGLLPSAWRPSQQMELQALRDAVTARLEKLGLANRIVQLASRGTSFVQDLITEYAQEGGLSYIGSRLREAKIQSRLEEDLIRQFFELADRAHIEVPNAEELVEQLREEFQYFDPYPEFYRGHTAAHVPQHHGVPTRLLDWSRRPETAAFFAAKSLESKDHAEAISVWAMNRRELRHERWSPYEPHIFVIERPSFHDGFIASQEAAFTTIRLADKWYVRHGHWPSIEDLWENFSAPTDGLLRMDLPREYVDRLLDLLKRDGYFEPRLFPSLDHMAIAMKRLGWLGGYP